VIQFEPIDASSAAAYPECGYSDTALPLRQYRNDEVLVGIDVRPEVAREVQNAPGAGVPAADRHFLQEIIRTVSSTLDLDRVLGAIVGLLTEAAECHACYVFLADDRARMALRACSEPYTRFVGQIVMEPGEGLAGWVAKHREPVFITQDAASDPRMRVFEEFEEEKYQSLVSVPLLAKDGSVLGVVALHAEAPHEYSADDARLLLTSASLVAGAIENAQLHEETERRVAVLERLFETSEAIAGAETLDGLLPAVAKRLTPLLGARACEIYLLEPDGERLRLRAACPGPVSHRIIGITDLGVALALPRVGGRDARGAGVVVSDDDGNRPTLHVPLVVSGELLGLVIIRGEVDQRFAVEQRDLAATIVSQAALAVKKIQLVERLSERNLTKDFFDELEAGGAIGSLEGRARRLRCDLAQPRVVLWAAAAPGCDGTDWAGALEASLGAAFRGALIERSDTHVRALLPCIGAAECDLRERLRQIHRDAAPTAAIGLSSVCQGGATFQTGFAEARQALQGALVVQAKPGVVAFEELGPYKYLLRLAMDPGARDQHRDALRPLLEYDRAHRSQLFRTLEEYLQQRGRVASTAAKLYVHPNTLRQRLSRIESITGLDLEREDALTVEMAMKLLKLEEALAASPLGGV
jgi:GAF domain-containing protein